MQPDDVERDLIGFQDNCPIMKTFKFEAGGVGKSIILNGDQSSGKIFILNNKNVRIPVKVCGSVPENVRKVVLGKLPANVAADADKKRAAGKAEDKAPYLNRNVVVRDKATRFVNCGTSHASQTLDSEKSTAVRSDSASRGGNASKQDGNQSDTGKIKRYEKTIEPETKHPPQEDGLTQKARMDRKRKRQLMLRQQTIKREVMKCLKQSMKSMVKTRSISCQTESDSCNASSQTEQDNSMDLLMLLDDPGVDVRIGSPFPLGTFDSDMGVSPSRLISDGLPAFDGDARPVVTVDAKKRRFYEYLKNCDSTDPTGHIPLHLAVLGNNPFEVFNQCSMLKARNIAIDVPNNNGMTPLHLAVLNECEPKIVETLLENGADPLTKDGDGNSSLHNAVLCNATKDILVTLLNDVKRRGESVDVFNYEGFTPLMLCVIEDKHDMAYECVNADADPNTRDQKSGRTSLFHAVENNNLEFVKLFMQNGANTKIKNFFGTSTHEATFELENISHDIKVLIFGKDTTQNRSKPTPTRAKKAAYKAAEGARPPTTKNKLKTVRILRIIEKEPPNKAQ